MYNFINVEEFLGSVIHVIMNEGKPVKFKWMYNLQLESKQPMPVQISPNISLLQVNFHTHTYVLIKNYH